MKSTLLAIVVSVLIVGGAFVLASRSSGADASANNVRIENGVQIIEVSVKGGYYPKKSTAKAGIPTVVRFNTNGTYDCSSSVRIPSMNISQFLPPSGATDIDIGSPQASAVQGTCGMGMYSFEIDFQS